MKKTDKLITTFQFRNPKWDAAPVVRLWLDDKSQLMFDITEPKEPDHPFQHGFWWDQYPEKPQYIKDQFDLIKAIKTQFFFAKDPYDKVDTTGTTLITPIYFIAAGDEGEDVLAYYNLKTGKPTYRKNGAYFSMDDDAAMDGPVAAPTNTFKTLDKVFKEFSRLGSGLFLVYRDMNQFQGSWAQDFWGMGLVKSVVDELSETRN